jgi:hypothetical protein
MTTWKIAEPERLALDGEVRELNVTLVGGRLNVVGADGPARVEVSAIGERPLMVHLDERGLLSIGHERLPKWPGFLRWLIGKRFTVDVSVVVPTAAPVDLTVVSGSVIASSLHGGATVEVTSGRITLLGIDGVVSAKVTSGSIEALTLGGDVDLESVSGEIVVADSTARRVHARSISGSVTCDLDNPSIGSDVRLDTVSGEITARVREDSDLEVHLNTVSGRVLNTFAGLDHAGRGSVSGRIGTGTGRLAANATTGTISLLRRPVGDLDEEPGRGSGVSA